MSCLKCKRDTDSTNVFCQECLAVMDHYPIAQGTPVQLPLRPSRNQEKPGSHHRERTPEEVILRLRILIRWLALGIAVLAIAVGILSGILVNTLTNQEETEPSIGRNYTTETNPGSTPEP